MKFYKFLFICVLFFACKGNQDKQFGIPNEKILGRWYYTDAPDSYIDINETIYREHLGEINSNFTCQIYWVDSSHYELKVIEATGNIKKTMKPGNKIKVEVIEPTADYFRFIIPILIFFHFGSFTNFKHYLSVKVISFISINLWNL